MRTLRTMPHIMEEWTQQDLQDLTTEEIQRLMVSMNNKYYRVLAEYENRTTFYYKNFPRIEALADLRKHMIEEPTTTTK